MLELNCLCIGDQNQSFPVKIDEEETVGDLKELIKEKNKPEFDHLPAKSLEVSQVSIPYDELQGPLQDLTQFKSRPMLPTTRLTQLFAQPPEDDHIHVLVKAPTMAESERASKRIRMSGDVMDSSKKIPIPDRKWALNGAIQASDASTYYYLDPANQPSTESCLDAVRYNQIALLSGARSSGKTTRLLRLQQLLNKMGYQGLYVSFERLVYTQSEELFWRSLGKALRLSEPTSFHADVLNAFAAGNWELPVVLLIDEFSELDIAPVNIKNNFLRMLREIRNNRLAYAICSTIATGTFNILRLNTTGSHLAPFNVSNSIQTSHFDIDEVKTLFYKFANDNDIVIDDEVIQDVWAKSNGHPGMVCLCGRVISNRLPSLLEHDSRTLPYRNWDGIPVEVLYTEINAYNTFRSLVASLCRPEARPAVELFRIAFAGFLDEVTIVFPDEELADLLTTEGALVRPEVTSLRYRVASPLIDGLMRMRVIPTQFPNAPSTVLPEAPRVRDLLIESLKYFDKHLMRSSPFRSFKSSLVPVGGRLGAPVPRESVYDTELMRILTNWLAVQHGWTITGQWHLRTAHGQNKYTDIIIQKPGERPIVLELLATGNAHFFKSHIEKTPAYMDLLSTEEGWVVHFTCEDNYHPIWQSAVQLDKGVNVVHFCHNVQFTRVRVWARWKDSTGNTIQEEQEFNI